MVKLYTEVQKSFIGRSFNAGFINFKNHHRDSGSEGTDHIVRVVPDTGLAGYPANFFAGYCLPDPDQDRISKNANIRHNPNFQPTLLLTLLTDGGPTK